MGTLLQEQAFASEGTLGTAQNRGNAFVAPTDPPPIEYIGFYRAAVGSNRTPQALRVYDQTDGTSVSPPSIVDDGAVGWQWSPLSAPYVLVGGRDYIVATGWNNGQTIANATASDPGAPDDGFTWESPEFRYSNNGPNSFPDQTIDNNYAAVDVMWEDAPTGGNEAPDGPSGNDGDPTLLADLAWWMHEDTTNPNSLPSLTKAVVDDVADAVGDLGSAITTLGGNVTTLLTRTAGMVGGTIQTALDDLGTALTGTVNAFSATFDAFNTTWDAFGTAFSQLVGGTHNRSIVDTTAVGDPTFTETDSDTGIGPFIFNVPADFYILTITNPAALRQGTTIGGVPYFKHRGAWCSLDDGVCGDHHTIVGTSHVLRERGAQLQGVLVYLDPHIEWAIQAFSYVPPGP